MIIVIYHFGFWMHWLDLGRSTGVAEIWSLHSQEVGVHWHLSLHLRERKATESESEKNSLGHRQSCISLSSGSFGISLNNSGERLWSGEGRQHTLLSLKLKDIKELIQSQAFYQRCPMPRRTMLSWYICKQKYGLFPLLQTLQLPLVMLLFINRKNNVCIEKCWKDIHQMVISGYPRFFLPSFSFMQNHESY